MIEFWRWSRSELKVYVEPDFGRYLMRTFRPANDRKRIRWSAEYRNRDGRIVAYDFVIQSRERSRIELLYKQFGSRKSGTESAENEAESIGEIAQ
jgi:hypothetical protein